MKKLILFLTLLFVGLGSTFEANAQYSPSNNLNYIKLLKTPPIGSVEDSVMVYDSSSSFVKMIPKSSIVAGYELKSNKQNDLTPDGTGTKYSTVDAVNTKVSNIDNTSDANKPVSTATQTALNLKENVANKSDSYTSSSSTTYVSTKALVDGLSTKAPISNSTNYIQNQNASAQSANMWISGNVKARAGTFSSKVSTVGVASVIESNGGFNIVSSSVNNYNTSYTITNSAASKVYAFTAGKPNVSHDGFGLWNVTDNTYPIWVEPNGSISLNANISSKVSTVGATSVIESNGGFNAVSSNVNLDNVSFKIMNSAASKVYAFTAGTQGVSHDGFGLWNVTDNTHPVWVEPSGDVSLNANTTVSGTVTATPATLDTQLATLGQVKGIADLKAPIASPVLTGIPTAPTAPVGTNTTQIATMEAVQTAVDLALANSSTGPYKVYTALLSQTGTSAPTAIVLENTFGGAIVWSYVAIGQYNATLNGAFTNNKTAIRPFETSSTVGSGRSTHLSDSIIRFSTVGASGVNVDSILTSKLIEIRVYN